jgi:hypothetical protein
MMGTAHKAKALASPAMNWQDHSNHSTSNDGEQQWRLEKYW